MLTLIGVFALGSVGCAAANPVRLPTSDPTGGPEGEASFQLVGDMTLHGVTRPLTWDATAQFENGTLTSQARTNFPFEKFDLEVPRGRILLSVDNNIRLELELIGSVS